jgi:hypothetical protein
MTKKPFQERKSRSIHPRVYAASTPQWGSEPAVEVETIISEIAPRLAAATIEDMRARYELGRALRDLRSRVTREPSSGALSGLANRLGIDPSALRRYMRVTKIMPLREFEWLTELRSPRGAPLTWSHVEVLVREPDAARRRALATVTANQELTVRALAARIETEGRTA